MRIAWAAGIVLGLALLIPANPVLSQEAGGEGRVKFWISFTDKDAGAGKGPRSLPAIKAVADLTYMGRSYQRVIPDIAQDNTLAVVRFMQKSHEDEALRSRLQAGFFSRLFLIT